MTPRLETIKGRTEDLPASSQPRFFMGPGYTVLRSHLVPSASVTLADIEAIQLRLNGTAYRDLGSATNLDKHNQFDGIPAFSANGVLTIDHTRTGLRRFVETHISGIGMDPKAENPIDSLEIVLTIGSGIAASQTCTVYHEVTNAAGTTMVIKETSRVFTYTGNGEQIIDDLVKSNQESIASIALFEGSLSVDELEVRNARKTVFHRTDDLNTHIINSAPFKTVQSGLFVFDKGERGFGKEPLVTRRDDLELILQVSGISGSGTVTVQKRELVRWQG